MTSGVDAALLAAPIVVAEDEEPVRRLIIRMLQRDGYTSVSAVDAVMAVPEALRRTGAHLLLLDLHMPGGTGFDVLAEVQSGFPESARPQVVVLTGDHSRDARHRALAAGAADFLTKPLDALEVLLRVRNLLRMHALQRAQQQQNERLESMVRLRTAELDRAQLEVLERLARAAEHRDDDTGQHTRRVAELSGRLALRHGLDPAEAELIRRAALLHDVGKIGIPDAVLLKADRLTEHEWRIMQRHAEYGAAILAGSEVPLLQVAESIARSHHERWDGTGYPQGLAGEAIPLAARIVAVADAFDAMSYRRTYRTALTPAAVRAELAAHQGGQFDPVIVQHLLDIMDLPEVVPLPT